MNYRETLAYLFNALPMYQRVGAAAYKADLSNTIELCRRLGNPEKGLRCIHIAGTNGKGSVSHLLASVFQEAGYKTGLFTSPHLKDFRERIRINGKMVSKKWVCDFVVRNKKHFNKINPSFFEMTAAMAFDYFRDKKTDIAIIETGMGGRLDSTNVVNPEFSIITHISYDHEKFLGETLKKIAGEKAGIIKPGRPVIIGHHQRETDAVFLKKAKANGSEIIFADDHIGSKHLPSSGEGTFKIKLISGQPRDLGIWKCGLKGSYQEKNLPAVLVALHQFEKISGERISGKAIKAGIKNVVKNTGLKGRWEVIGKSPLIIADGAHNPGGLEVVIPELRKVNKGRLHIVLGIVNDKEPGKILGHFPREASYYFTQARIPRALEAGKLWEAGKKFGLMGDAYPSVRLALKAAKLKAGRGDTIFIGGSLFVVAEAL